MIALELEGFTVGSAGADGFAIQLLNATRRPRRSASADGKRPRGKLAWLGRQAIHIAGGHVHRVVVARSLHAQLIAGDSEHAAFEELRGSLLHHDAIAAHVALVKRRGRSLVALAAGQQTEAKQQPDARAANTLE